MAEKPNDKAEVMCFNKFNKDFKNDPHQNKQTRKPTIEKHVAYFYFFSKFANFCNDLKIISG